ncbi:hypothetical protein BH10ACI3_BH10ACI3_14480 [soil metagenome]
MIVCNARKVTNYKHALIFATNAIYFSLYLMTRYFVKDKI